MKTIITLVLAVGLLVPAFGQNLAADCNGSTSMTAIAGDAVDGATGLTMGGWVFPRDAVGGYPNFDGFFGFRNNFDFDFYILQLNATNMEARFRNSAGINYDLVPTSLQVNQWQHVALTYDGSQIAFYYNGVLEATLPASGSISALGETFHMGQTPFSFTPFSLDGQLDNIQVWTRALSATEITDLHCREELDVATYPDLALHYRLNDGAGATTAVDAAGGYDATVATGVSWPATGASSCDAVACSSASAPANPVHTDGATSTTLSWDPIAASVACQIKGTRLIPPGPSPSLNTFGFEVSMVNVPYAAVGAGTTWEWAVRCACSTSPVDATPFSVKDTFAVPVLRVEKLSDQILIYPNPVADRAVLSISEAYTSDMQINTLDLLGRSMQLLLLPAGSTKLEINLSDVPDGQYFIRIGNEKAIPFEVLKK